jgi:uncharacterized Ntn-hydrolase superfamily protein
VKRVSFSRDRALALFCFLFGSLVSGPAAATFSLLAVDTERREVGIAVASCVGSSVDLGELVLLDDMVGGVVAQSYFFPVGRDELLRQLSLGATPQAAIEAVTTEAFDPAGNETGFAFRQYGVVDFSHPSAAFTGAENLSEAGHRFISVDSFRATAQGNVLSDLSVLSRLEAGFVGNSGTLGTRLIGALEEVEKGTTGDRRCAPALADAYYVRIQGRDSWEERMNSEKPEEIAAWLREVRTTHPEKSPKPSSAAPQTGGCAYSYDSSGAGSLGLFAAALAGLRRIARRGAQATSCSRG